MKMGRMVPRLSTRISEKPPRRNWQRGLVTHSFSALPSSRQHMSWKDLPIFRCTSRRFGDELGSADACEEGCC